MNLNKQTMKVTINKETGLGNPSNPFSYNSEVENAIKNGVYSAYESFAKDNPPLPVISQSNEILTEGEFEVEKVWQWFNNHNNWEDFEMDSRYYESYPTREIYKVLPTQPDVKETVELAAKEYSIARGRFSESTPDGLGFIAGANWHKQQVLEEIEKCNRGDQNMIRLIKVIKEM